MNKVIKLKQTEDFKVFFTSDLHIFHNPKWPIPIWKMRGHNSVQEHTQFVIDKINEVVRPDDVIFNLGDLTLNCSESMFEEFLSQIKCQNMYILFGNHNSPCWNIYKREIKTFFHSNEDIELYPFRYRNLIFIGNYAEVVVDGKYFILSHYPMYVWNYIKDGALHLTGHSHCKLPFSQSSNLDAKILDCGWDEFKKPLSVEEILSIMDKKKVFNPGDHHSKDNNNKNV